jgi:hypothetical protein
VSLVRTLRAEAAAPPPGEGEPAAAAAHLRLVLDALSGAASALDATRHEPLLTEVLHVEAWSVDEVRFGGVERQGSAPFSFLLFRAAAG